MTIDVSNQPIYNFTFWNGYHFTEVKLCYVTQTGFGEPCAELTHAVEIIRALRLLGHEVCVMHAGTRGSLADLDVQVQKAPFGTGGLSKLAFQVWLVAKLFLGYRKGLFDFCYVRHSARMLSPSLVAKVTGMPVIAEFNACFAIKELNQGKWYLERMVRYIERHSLRHSSLVVVISDVVRDLMLMKHGIEEDKIIVAHNGANTQLMKPMSGGSIRQEHGIGKDDFVIGFVGYLHPWQGIDELLEVFRRLHQKKPGAWLVIAGTHDDLPRYQQQAKALEIDGKVIFLGPVEYQKVPGVMVQVLPTQYHQAHEIRRVVLPVELQQVIANRGTGTVGQGFPSAHTENTGGMLGVDHFPEHVQVAASVRLQT